ncbi:hypothetical protein ACLK17_21950 [Escherichia coli]
MEDNWKTRLWCLGTGLGSVANGTEVMQFTLLPGGRRSEVERGKVRSPTVGTLGHAHFRA